MLGTRDELWGPQGPITNKVPPFIHSPISSDLDVMSVRMEIQYALRCGTRYVIWVDRTLASHDDILTYLPDDVVQMANLIDFRPRTGLYRTSAAPGDVVYRVAEMGGFNDPTSGLNNPSDITQPNYVPEELGL
jgi:hypothetical protein